MTEQEKAEYSKAVSRWENTEQFEYWNRSPPFFPDGYLDLAGFSGRTFHEIDTNSLQLIVGPNLEIQEKYAGIDIDTDSLVWNLTASDVEAQAPRGSGRGGRIHPEPALRRSDSLQLPLAALVAQAQGTPPSTPPKSGGTPKSSPVLAPQEPPSAVPALASPTPAPAAALSPSPPASNSPVAAASQNGSSQEPSTPPPNVPQVGPMDPAKLGLLRAKIEAVRKRMNEAVDGKGHGKVVPSKEKDGQQASPRAKRIKSKSKSKSRSKSKSKSKSKSPTPPRPKDSVKKAPPSPKRVASHTVAKPKKERQPKPQPRAVSASPKEIERSPRNKETKDSTKRRRVEETGLPQPSAKGSLPQASNPKSSSREEAPLKRQRIEEDANTKRRESRVELRAAPRRQEEAAPNADLLRRVLCGRGKAASSPQEVIGASTARIRKALEPGKSRRF